MPQERFSILVTEDQRGLRLDQILATVISRRKAKKLLSYGAVFVDGKRVKVASRNVSPGAKITAPYELPPPPPPINWSETILRTTHHLVMVNKPYRWPAAPTPLGDKGTLSFALGEHLGREVFVVQRLDAHTTGVLVYTLTPMGTKAMTRAFMEKRVHKEYIAIVPGGPLNEGMISLPLSPDPDNKGRIMVDPRGKEALTEVLKVHPLDDAYQLVHLKLHTGRTHQIRVHLSHLGFPVVGDHWYKGEQRNRLFLHSYRLTLSAPLLGDHRITAPLPPYWAEYFPNSIKDSIKILD